MRPRGEGCADDVLRRAATGDVDAFEQAYDRFASRVYGLALAVTGDAEAAGQVLVEVFAALRAGRLPSVGGPAHVALLAEAHRRAVCSRRAGEGGIPAQPDPPRVGVDWPEHSQLRHLAPEQRQILRLVYLGGKTVREAAYESSMTEADARSALTAAMRSLSRRPAGRETLR